MFRRPDHVHGKMTRVLAYGIAVPAAFIALTLPARPSMAAALSGAITGWSKGDVPSYISMYEYVPGTLAAKPPIVVASHYCGGSASAFFSMASGVVAAADKYGFIMIFPQTTNNATSAKCWDVGSTASLTHDGKGDTQAIVEMVNYEISKRGADANRVYAMGASSGAMMTEALMAVYPDVFKAGAEFSGVPAGCWAVGWSAASNWSGQCAGGQVKHTGAEWGAIVAKMYPGYSGYRPRLQLWHGTADSTINYENQNQAINEWTNVLGVTQSTTTTSGQYTIQTWKNSCGLPVVEAHTQANGGHTTPIDANAVVTFFGLDKTGADPGTTCSSSSSSSSGSTSSSSRASSSSSSGAISSVGHSSSTSGAVSSVGHSSSSSGAASTSGGQSSTGSSGATTSSSGGGVSSSSGSTSGSTSSGGASTGSGGGEAGGGGAGGGGSGSDSNGCSCRITGSGTASQAWLAALAVAWVAVRRRRRNS